MELGLEMEHPKCTAGGSPRASPGGGHVLVNLSLFYSSTEPQYSSKVLQIDSTFLQFYRATVQFYTSTAPSQLEISTAQSRVRLHNSEGLSVSSEVGSYIQVVLGLVEL